MSQEVDNGLAGRLYLALCIKDVHLAANGVEKVTASIKLGEVLADRFDEKALMRQLMVDPLLKKTWDENYGVRKAYQTVRETK